MSEQLKCKLCKTKRELTEEEITTTRDIISKRNLKLDSILDIWNLFDGEICPDGGTHEYTWNNEFLEKMIDDSNKQLNNEAEVVRNTNENIELENEIKEMTEKIQKNKERNTELQNNTEIIDNILKTSGRTWKEWL